MGCGRGSMAVRAIPPNHLTIAMLNHSQQALSPDTAVMMGGCAFCTGVQAESAIRLIEPAGIGAFNEGDRADGASARL